MVLPLTRYFPELVEDIRRSNAKKFVLDSEIDVGFTDAKGNYTSYSSNSNYYPNTVKVTMWRDSNAKGAMALFFAPVFGVDATSPQKKGMAPVSLQPINAEVADGPKH